MTNLLITRKIDQKRMVRPPTSTPSPAKKTEKEKNVGYNNSELHKMCATKIPSECLWHEKWPVWGFMLAGQCNLFRVSVIESLHYFLLEVVDFSPVYAV